MMPSRQSNDRNDTRQFRWFTAGSTGTRPDASHPRQLAPPTPHGIPSTRYPGQSKHLNPPHQWSLANLRDPETTTKSP
jgi:hypothetical protein